MWKYHTSESSDAPSPIAQIFITLVLVLHAGLGRGDFVDDFMSEKEMRELDVWIANIMEWKPSVDGGICWDADGKPIASVPHYTTDLAAAGEVLEKCARKNINVEIDFSEGKFCVGFFRSGVCVVGEASETLPLAIAFFAKELFSK